jgi:hypothetical protein
MAWFSKKQPEVVVQEIDNDEADILYLWRIFQDNNNDYDTYSAAVVVAASRREARHIHPNGKSGTDWDGYRDYSSWTSPENVKVTKLGVAAPHLKDGEVVLSSFHAG